jgi:hypothetical protein
MTVKLCKAIAYGEEGRAVIERGPECFDPARLFFLTLGSYLGMFIL